ncbi:MAG: OmpA family protein, partial [Novosphingobium sp.]
MTIITTRPGGLFLLAMLAVPAWAGASAQPQSEPRIESAGAELTGTVSDTSPPTLAELTEGPEIKGLISAR